MGSGNSFSADRKGSCLFIHNHLAGHEIRAQSAEGSGCISFAKVADDPFDHGFLEPGIERASDAVIDSVAVSPIYFGLSVGLTKLRPLGPVPLTCKTVSSSISM